MAKITPPEGWDIVYDREADVVYATTLHSANSPEPQVGIEVGENGILDVGMFSGLPVGFRILFISNLDESARTEIMGEIYAEARNRIAKLECRFTGDARETIDCVLQLA